MLKILMEQTSLLGILFIIFVGMGVYYDRSKARRNETSQQQLANDLFAVISVFFAFSFLTFVVMNMTGNTWNQNNYIEIETLADAQRYLREQDQELKIMRTNHNNFVGLTKTFVVASAMTLMLVFKILKTYHQNLGKK